MLTADDLRTLLDVAAGPAVSIFLPTDVAGREIRQAPIRLRKLLEEAASELTAAGHRRSEAEALLAPARRLLADREFWHHQGQGLALFAAPGTFRAIRVPIALGEHVVVLRRFFLKPLLPLFEQHRRFLLLALSARRVRVFDADCRDMAELPVLHLEPGVAAVLAETDYEETRERNPGEGPGRPGGVAKTQPLGDSPEEERKDELVEYLRRVSAALEARLAGDPRPILVVAQPEIRGNFLKLSRLASLLSQALDLNPDALDERTLHRRACALMEPLFAQSRTALKQRLEQLLGEKDRRATADPAAILPAAHDGRVDTLFLAEGADLWGRYDHAAHSAAIHEQRKDADEELLDDAAVETLRRRGNVLVMPRGALPSGSITAALLRY